MQALAEKKHQAANFLYQFKGIHYAFGIGAENHLGALARHHGTRATVIALSPGKSWAKPLHMAAIESLQSHELTMTGKLIPGAQPNAPYEDVFRLSEVIKDHDPHVVVSIGGGSSIDATKAAIAYAALGDIYPDINNYFGINKVAEMLKKSKRQLKPMLAMATVAGASAHLTRYANITDMKTGQKRLIIDDLLTPQKAIFDYRHTLTQPKELTLDGAFDGIAHNLEVLMGIPNENYPKIKAQAELGIELIVNHIERTTEEPLNEQYREYIGLGTDLGGHAIMVGGTNGAHLNSFSLTDILNHGRACALLEPYYVVFFAASIENRLRPVAEIYQKAGYLTSTIDRLHGRDLGLALAEAMLNVSERLQYPTRLQDVPGFSDKHIDKCLQAAKEPALESKLKNMPIPLTAKQVDDKMGMVLDAAKHGDFSLIK